MIIKSWNFFN